MKELGYRVEELNDTILGYRSQFGSANLTIELQSQTARAETQREINALKRMYSQKTLEEVAKKKRWLLKKGKEQNKFELRRQ